MKGKEKFRSYFQKRINTINLLKKKATHSFTPSDYHSLRIEIKKLNAILEFINFYKSDFKKKHFIKNYKNIFKTAGKIREFQLEEDFIKKSKSKNLLKDYSRRLKELKQKEKIVFQKEIKGKFTGEIKKSHKQVLKVLNKATEEDAVNYLRVRKNKIETLFGGKKVKQKKVHELRKKLKEFFYNTKMLGGKESHKNEVKMDNFQELLGKWHDKIVIIKHLKETVKSDKIGEKELQQLIKLKWNLVSGREMLFRKITKIIESKVLRQ
ncbi:MAG TPA: CHAD domain-containing protein [Bacteroidia bacterium]|jgi:CHAD domain-containing protein|nr:CHAD domain-containing protein [Bacteroidia bacterium]